MRKSIVSVLVALTVGLAAALAPAASELGTKEEAKVLVEKASSHLKKVGKEKALQDFSDPKGAFVDRDLYIFAIDFKGMTLAHGGNPKLIGKDLSGMQDAGGKYFIRELMDTAKKGSGWYDYKWSNPVSKRIQDKTSYVVKVDETFFIGCGAYK